MKKKYEVPSMDIIKIKLCNMIATSVTMNAENADSEGLAPEFVW